jgi:hypothetical protein
MHVKKFGENLYTEDYSLNFQHMPHSVHCTLYLMFVRAYGVLGM